MEIGNRTYTSNNLLKLLVLNIQGTKKEEGCITQQCWPGHLGKEFISM